MTIIGYSSEKHCSKHLTRLDVGLADFSEGLLVSDRLVQSGSLRVSHAKAGIPLTESQAQQFISEGLAEAEVGVYHLWRDTDGNPMPSDVAGRQKLLADLQARAAELDAERMVLQVAQLLIDSTQGSIPPQRM